MRRVVLGLASVSIASACDDVGKPEAGDAKPAAAERRAEAKPSAPDAPAPAAKEESPATPLEVKAKPDSEPEAAAKLEPTPDSAEKAEVEPTPDSAEKAEVEPEASAEAEAESAETAEPDGASEGAAAPAKPATPVTPPAAFVPEESRVSPKMLRRVRSQLREKHGANVVLAASAELPLDDGGVAVFALYEYSRLQACASKGGGTAEARKRCVESAVDDGEWHEGYAKSDYDCNEQGLVRATFGPAPAKNPAYGGPLTIEADRPLPKSCRVSKVDEFVLVDLDRDGALELAVWYGAVTPNPFAREGGSYDAFTFRRGWYRQDLEPQAELLTADWVSEDGAWGYVSSSAMEFVDPDGDGRIDLQLTRHEADYNAEGVLPAICYPKSDGKPIDPVACQRVLDADEEYTEADIEVKTTVSVGRYDAKADVWVFDRPAQ
jgi:hypothetical protein